MPLWSKFIFGLEDGTNHAKWAARVRFEEGKLVSVGFDSVWVAINETTGQKLSHQELKLSSNRDEKKKAKRELFEEVTDDENIMQVYHLCYDQKEDYWENNRQFQAFKKKFLRHQAETLNIRKPDVVDRVEPPSSAKRPRPTSYNFGQDSDYEDEDSAPVQAAPAADSTQVAGQRRLSFQCRICGMPGAKDATFYDTARALLTLSAGAGGSAQPQAAVDPPPEIIDLDAE